MRFSSFLFGALAFAVSGVYASSASQNEDTDLYCLQGSCEDATPKDCSVLGDNWVSTPAFDDDGNILCYQCCQEEEED
ncbi:hypothetical protein N7457_001579 [Penicillium paradoxum]|uniref:uncharacterized protein n=1 Tax=Penicillium paradoxum TaxID=176176 RepID=UPI0025489A36|nr:uncharacterized protein N7457_001579 [Penicillium paradoxum]KAJ5794980.1 hypothetical protein N7457_001579 [Penicillium paradoxum]